MEETKHHVHPLYIAESTFVLCIILFIVNTSFVELLEAINEDTPNTITTALISFFSISPVMRIVFAGIIPFIIIEAIVYLRYRCLYFTLGEREISLYSGVVVRKRRHLAYERVQSINEQATLIMRILGLVNLEVECAGGSSNDSFVIPWVSKGMAINIKRDLFARRRALEQQAAHKAPVSPLEQRAQVQAATVASTGKQNAIDKTFGQTADFDGIFAQTDGNMERVDFSVSITNKELFLAALANQRVILTTFVAILIIFSQVGSILGAIASDRPELKSILKDTVLNEALWTAIPFVTGLTLVGLLISVLIAVIASVFKQAGFKLERKGQRVEISHGLLTRYYSGINIDRIQELKIKQGVLHRILGYAEVKAGRIDALKGAKGQEDENKGEIMLHPFYPLDKVSDLIENLTPEYLEAPAAANIFPARVALRRSVIRNFWMRTPAFTMIIVALSCELVILNPPFGLEASELWQLQIISYIMLVLGIFFAIGGFISAQQWFKHSGLAANERFLLLEQGGINLVRYVIPRNKIQYGELMANPLQQKAQVTSFIVKTAAGIGSAGSRHRIYDLEAADANKLLEWLFPRGVLK